MKTTLVRSENFINKIPEFYDISEVKGKQNASKFITPNKNQFIRVQNCLYYIK